MINYEVTMMKIENLKSTSYQRERINFDKVKQIAYEFDPNMFDPIRVSLRKDGFYYVMDGQHRLLAFKRKGEKEILCRIVPANGKEHEAEMFRKLNGKYGSQKITQYDDFVAAKESADPEALEIDSIISKYGFRINHTQSDNNIAAVAALRYIFRKYKAPLLDSILHIIKYGCQGNRAGLQANFLKGLACFLYTHNTNSSFSREIFLEKLKATPAEEILKYLNYRTAISFDKTSVDVFTNLYNKNQRKNKI